MNFKIDKIEEKPLLKRKEVYATATFQGKATPSNVEIKKAIAKETNADEKAVIVRSIYTGFGSSEAAIKAHVYESVDDMKKIEPKKLQPKEPEKKEEAPVAEEDKAKEKPAEEVPKEEAKPEEKSE